MTVTAPAFDVTEITNWQGHVVREIRSCAHANILPVESSVTGETIAHLCADCDRQFA